MTSGSARPAPLSAVAGLLALLLLGCGWNDDGAPCADDGRRAGELTLWAACDAGLSADGELELQLSNDSAGPAWAYRHCHGLLPWLAVLEDDGSWTSLLDPGVTLALACEHVHRLEPGQGMSLSLRPEELEPGRLYRAELLVGRDCGDLHDPRHLASACSSIELVVSEPLLLN